MGSFSLLQFSCLLMIVFIYCNAAENKPGKFSNVQTYNQSKLLTTFLKDLQTFLKPDSPISLRDLFLESTDRNFVIESLQNSTQASSKCLNDVYFLLSSSADALRLLLLSYSGKPDTSFFKGNTKFLGNYNGCIRLKSRNNNASFGNFNGKYCTLKVFLLINNKTIPIMNGICVPDTCSADDLVNILKFLRSSNVLPAVNYTKFSLSCETTEYSLTALDKGVLAVLLLFCVLAILGSSFKVIDYTKSLFEQSRVSDSDCNKEDPNQKKIINCNGDISFQKTDLPDGNSDLSKVKQVLQCFCIFTNGAKLLNSHTSGEEFLFFHGIRFISMSWIILSHVYVFSMQFTENMLDVSLAMDDIAYQIPLQGCYAVDSFFLLSGFLLSYWMMKNFSERKGDIPWLYFYIHRYIRINSIYLIVLGVWATIFFRIGSGPFWPNNVMHSKCEENWWWNLLYINNFFPLDDMCMAWSWFLATDMQFFVISPLFLIPLWRWPKIGYGLLTTFVVACSLTNFLITYHSNLLVGYGHILRSAVISGVLAKVQFVLFVDEIYTKPYTRISSYLIGIALGYLCFKQCVTCKPKHGLLFLSIGWIVSITTILVTVFGLYNNDLDLLASCFYNSFHRIAFVLGESWIIYVCFIGQGGLADKILSWKLFMPLSRLTYATYLIHPMILLGYFLSLKSNFQFSHETVLLLFLGMSAASYILALPVSLLFESPIIRLEKLLRNRLERKEKQLRHDKEL